jgi:hypothetical protein
VAGSWASPHLSLLGGFKHQDRIDLYEHLAAKGKDAPSDSSVAREMLLHFGITERQLPEVGYIGFEYISIGDAKPFGGYVYARSTDREKKKRLANLEEFRDWAYAEGTVYGWVSFGLLIAGLLLKTATSRLDIRGSEGSPNPSL